MRAKVVAASGRGDVRSSASIGFRAWVAVLILLTASAAAQNSSNGKGQQHFPQPRPVQSFPPLNFAAAAAKEAKNPPKNPENGEVDEVPAPALPPERNFHVPINLAGQTGTATPRMLTSSGTGVSPAPSQTFPAEFESGQQIPPDTMGAVGKNFIVTVTNDRVRIQTRDGVQVQRMTLAGFWGGITIKGVAISSAFDPKVLYDRFNDRFILISSANGQGVNSGAMFAVSTSPDPTGTWNRWAVVADASSTSTSGKWIDYPSIGFNNTWIVIDYNVFSYNCSGSCTSTYWGQYVYALDKQGAYNNAVGTINLFQGDASTCTGPSAATLLACGTTMVPAITEDSATTTEYVIENWDSVNGQLRLSKMTGTASAPVLTVGTQFPQSTNSWRVDSLILTTSGGANTFGYIPQRQQGAYAPSGTRIMANDARLQNAVLRSGKLWTVHTVMLSSTPQTAGTRIGGSGNPVDNHTAVQWWQIDPTNETGASTAPLQRGRIEDPTANNCHNGTGSTSTTAPCDGTTAKQFGEFVAFPSISVNQNGDAVIGFTSFSALSYPSSGYVFRASTDTANTTRDRVIFRPGQTNYNTHCASCSPVQSRWGDYSAAQTDPLNDTDFWTIQEYSGVYRNDFTGSFQAPWETWWTKISPGNPAGGSGTLIIDEFRLRGPQGARDEFIKLYNPGSTPVIVSTTDNSDGWALAYSTDGLTAIPFAVVPNGTVIPPHGYFLIANGPDSVGATSATTYSLTQYPGNLTRGATSDTGFAIDIPDNAGIALFSTANTANFSTTRLDSVGFSSMASGGLFREGAGLAPISTTSPTGQSSFVRKMSAGVPVDTNANENDFVLVDPVLESLGVTPLLGAAGPQNLDGPAHGTNASDLSVALVDPLVIANATPNRVRGASTLAFRRAYTNNLSVPISVLRFRVFNMTAGPASIGTADLRLTSSANSTVPITGGGTANINGLTLEQPPPQAVGGGRNATVSLTPLTPIQPGATVNVEFLMNISQQGTYSFGVVPETFPPSGSAVSVLTGTTADQAPVAVNDNYVTEPNIALVVAAPGVLVNDSDPDGDPITAVAGTLPAHGSLTLNANGSFTYTPTAAYSGPDSFTYQASDGTLASASATVSINVVPGATHFLIAADPSGTAGSSVNFTVTAKDGSGNTVPGYTGTVHFTSSDGQAVLPADYTFVSGDSGVHMFTFTPKTSGSQTVTATDTGTSITGTSGSITVAATTPSSLAVSAPGSTTAGVAFSVTVTAKDTFNNVATGYTGTVHFTSTDGQAVLPADYAFVGADNGTHTFSVTTKTMGPQTVTAADTVAGPLHSTTGSIATAAAAVSTFAFVVPPSVTAGVTFSGTITAKDQYNNTVTSYAGTVHFSTSDAQATSNLPVDYPFQPSDNGSLTTSFVLKTLGNQTFTATDTVTASITRTTANIAVAAGATSGFVITGAPSSSAAGATLSATFTAKDAFNNTVTNYAGKVHFTSTDAQAVLPGDYTFIPADNGVHAFASAFTLKTSGAQTVTATDTGNSLVKGTTANINVTPGAAALLAVSAPSSISTGTAFNFTVTARDSFNNTATAYGGTVHFTTSDASPTLPANSTLTSGTKTFSATLRTIGAQTLTATDTANSTITGTANITVVLAPVITKSFGTNSLVLNTSTTLSFTIQNNNASSSISGIAFTDTLPAGLVVSTPNGLSGSCGGGTITATQGTGSVALSGATLAPSSSCTFSVNVTATSIGTKNNSVTVSATGGTGNTSVASLTVPSGCKVAILGGLALHDKTTNTAVNDPTPFTSGDAVDGLQATWAVDPTSGLLINSTGISEPVPDLLIYDAAGVAGSNYCFRAGNTITVTIDGTMSSPVPGNGAPASPANIDVYDSNGAVGLTVTGNSIGTTNGSGSQQTAITITVNQAGTAGSGPFFPTNAASGGAVGAAIRIKNLQFDATSVTGATISVTSAAPIINAATQASQAVAATLVSGLVRPVITTGFGASTIPVNTSTSLTFTLANNNTSTTLNNVSFFDNLPSGLVVAASNGLTNSCSGSAVTATAGSNAVFMSTGVTLAPSTSCTVSVNVTATSGGTKNNSVPVLSPTTGYGNTATASLTVTLPPGPTVTIEQASTQADPANQGPINFTVVFSEAVTGFSNSGVVVGGTATFGTRTIVVTGSGTTYNVAIDGMTAGGTVIPTVSAGAATSIATTAPSQASTSSDNVVTYAIKKRHGQVLTN